MKFVFRNLFFYDYYQSLYLLRFFSSLSCRLNSLRLKFKIFIIFKCLERNKRKKKSINKTYHSRSKLPLPVPVGDTSDFPLLILRNKRIWIVKLVTGFLFASAQHLLTEVVIDERSLQSQVPRRIQRIAVVLRRLHRRLVHRQ